ncbi:hypothetical protein [Pontibacter populi]|uniref:Uncharacterized protein n=1 Tax=Pontibacter populi TaxID=890055 RepID=A0ABV1RSN7_9BACT
MKTILRLKHWQVFLILLLIMLIGNTEIGGQEDLNIFLSLTGLLLYLTILVAYGHYLYDYLPRRVELNYNLFIINSFIFAVVVIAATTLFGPEGLHLTGLYALPIFYVFYAAYYTLAFPARVLKSIELNRNVEFGEYLVLAIGFIFWPFTIWFIQPRVNKIVAYGQIQPDEKQTIVNNN